MVRLAVVLWGCGGVDLPGTTDSEADCDGAEEFSVGVSATTPLQRTVAISAATPAPPDVGDNLWVLTITDVAGAPVSGLLPTVTPWMPLHGHGLSPAVYVGVEGEPGVYSVDTFDLVMPGLWQFTVTVEDGDAVEFDFCAAG